MRVIILGGKDSGAGKLARQIADRLHTEPAHTQGVYDLPWGAQSDVVCEWMEEPGPWVIAGPVAARALRKRLADLDKLEQRLPSMYAGARPCDLLLWLPQSPAVPKALRAKSAQLRSLYDQVKALCEARGVEVVELVDTRAKLLYGTKWRPSE